LPEKTLSDLTASRLLTYKAFGLLASRHNSSTSGARNQEACAK